MFLNFYQGSRRVSKGTVPSDDFLSRKDSMWTVDDLEILSVWISADRVKQLFRMIHYITERDKRSAILRILIYLKYTKIFFSHDQIRLKWSNKKLYLAN